MNNKNLTINFSEVCSKDIDIVGGKGANLGEMTQAGFPVPKGFCITTEAYDIFVESFGLIQEYYKKLSSIGEDIEATRVIGKKIRDSLMSLEIPESIEDSIISSIKKFGVDCTYAIRSSATAEDLPENSFAGQQDTYLNVSGQENIISAVKSCWASLFTDRAILYRNKNNFCHQAVKLSVVVQKMIPSEVSGIMFSADPLTGNRNIINIDASFGLGEALVSGLVNPDEYKIEKNTNNILQNRISQKLLAIYSNKNLGTYESKIPKEYQNKKVLNNEQILALGELAKKIEQHYDKPQDIEWGIYNNKIYLLQTRPITSLYPIENLQQEKDSLHIYFSMGHQQMMTDSMSPMGISTIKNILPIGKTDDKFESKYILDSGGRLFADITKLLKNSLTNKVLMKVSGQFNILAPKMLKQLRNKLNLKKHSGNLFSLKLFTKVISIFFKVIASLLWKNLDNTVEKANNRINNHIQSIKGSLDSVSTPEQKIEVCKKELSSLLPVAIFWIPNYISSTIADNIIRKILKNKVSLEDFENYKLGFKGNVVNEMNFDLGNLAETVRNIKQLKSFFKGDYKKTRDINAARGIVGCEEFFKLWDDFIDKYGARGSSEFDIARDRWYEDSTPLINVIINFLEKKPGEYLNTHEHLLNKQKQSLNNIVEASNKGIFRHIKTKIIKRMLYVVEKASVLREHHKFLAVKIMQVLKQELKMISKDFVTKNILASEEDIWYISWYELGNLDTLSDTLKNKVKLRKKDCKSYKKFTPPLIVTSDGETPIVSHDLKDVPKGAFVGQAVSSGVIEGIARVIKDPLKESLKKGEILVAPFTDPGWTPLFINAAGLITEVGGSLTHGSVVAREYSIPAVVGVVDITNKIQTGQKIRLDGNIGFVEIIESKN